MSRQPCALALVLVLTLGLVVCVWRAHSADVPRKKSLLDYSDADIEKLYDQWEENDDEKLPEDELPEYMRKLATPKPLDLASFKGKSAQEMKAFGKKDKSLMLFVTVSGDPFRSETEEITALWQSGLFNANYQISRYIVEDNKAIFMLKDGSKAWQVKDFLIQQERCQQVVIDDETYAGLKSTPPSSSSSSNQTDEF